MLNKTQLKSDLKQLFLNANEKTDNPDQAFDEFAEGLSNIIDAYIKGITITITSGKIITVGSSTTQTNTTPVIITNSIT